jgi:CBS domain-containing protein
MDELHRVRFVDRTLVETNGATKRTLRVFCPRYHESVPFENCRRCGRMTECDSSGLSCVTERARPLPVGPSSYGEVARAVPAGFVMRGVFCTFEETPLGVLGSVVRGERAVVVVDRAWHVVGVVDVPQRASGVEFVGDVMRKIASPIVEKSSIDDAVHLLATARTRRLPVVDARGELRGELLDVHAMHEVALMRVRIAPHLADLRAPIT